MGGGWRVDPKINPGGNFVDVGSHRFDMLAYLVGDVADVCGFAHKTGAARAEETGETDTAFALRFENGAIGSGSFRFGAGPARDVLEIYGDAGTMTFDPFDSDAFTVRALNGTATEHRYPAPIPAHLPFVQALVDAYRGQSDPDAHVTGEEGAKATRIMETILQSPPHQAA